MRYVHYYEQWLKKGPPVIKTYQITHVRLITVPNFDVVRALWHAACAVYRSPASRVVPVLCARAVGATRTSKCVSRERRSTTTRNT